MIKIYAKELPTPAEAKNRGLVLVELPANCHLDGDSHIASLIPAKTSEPKKARRK